MLVEWRNNIWMMNQEGRETKQWESDHDANQAYVWKEWESHERHYWRGRENQLKLELSGQSHIKVI
jgi:hypothetical protein